jgi:hypothetical protein
MAPHSPNYGIIGFNRLTIPISRNSAGSRIFSQKLEPFEFEAHLSTPGLEQTPEARSFRRACGSLAFLVAYYFWTAWC